MMLDPDTWWDWWPHLFSQACKYAAGESDDVSRMRNRKRYEAALSKVVARTQEAQGEMIEITVDVAPNSLLEAFAAARAETISDAFRT